MSIRSTNVYKPVKNLQVSVGVQYTQSTSQSGKPDYGSIKSGQWGVPYLQFADAKGNPLPIAQYLSKSYTDTAGAGKLLDWNYYPLEDYKHSVTTINQQDLLANIGISYQVKGGLSFDVKYLFERQTSRTNNLNDNQSYYTRDLINTFSQIDPNIGAVTYIVPNGGILNVSNSLLESQDVRGQTNYSHTYGKHDLVLLAGGEIRQAHNTGINTTYYGYDPNTLLTSNVDLVNYYPSYINGGTTNIPSNNLLTDRLNRYVSVYANGAYTYDNKYTISASGRRDASNLFGVNTNNKWKPLWSVGASWALSNESFYHVEWLPYLKLRATYGYTGNTDPFSTGILTVFYVNPQPPSNLPWTKINALLNPDLRWEQVKTINVGLDFRTLHDRIYGTIEGYIKNGLNLIGATAFDPSAGLNDQNTISKNVASMNGKGIDVTLNAKIFDHAFKWNTTILFSYNSSKTSKYYLDSNLLSSSFVGPGTIINPIPGQPLYSIGAYKWAGLDSQGNPQGYIDKKASTDYYTLTQLSKKEDLIYKPVMPVYFGSFINTFSWKELTLSINIVYRFRYYFMKPTLSYSSLFSGGATVGSGDYLKRWQKQGDEGITNVPSAIYPADQNRDLFYSYSMINVDKGDNIKIQYINLSYDFSKIVKKVNFSHLQLFLNSSNWGMIWKANKDGIDPDYIGAPKIGKTYAIGIKTGF